MRWHGLPAEVYALVERTPATVLLESTRPNRAESGEKPWTRLFAAPVRLCVAWRPEDLPALFQEIEDAVARGGSAAGFFGYECGIGLEPKAGMRPGREHGPLAWFGIYERGYAFDHATGTFAAGAPP